MKITGALAFAAVAAAIPLTPIQSTSVRSSSNNIIKAATATRKPAVELDSSSNTPTPSYPPSIAGLPPFLLKKVSSEFRDAPLIEAPGPANQKRGSAAWSSSPSTADYGQLKHGVNMKAAMNAVGAASDLRRRILLAPPATFRPLLSVPTVPTSKPAAATKTTTKTAITIPPAPVLPAPSAQPGHPSGYIRPIAVPAPKLALNGAKPAPILGTTKQAAPGPAVAPAVAPAPGGFKPIAGTTKPPVLAVREHHAEGKPEAVEHAPVRVPTAKGHAHSRRDGAAHGKEGLHIEVDATSQRLRPVELTGQEQRGKTTASLGAGGAKAD